MKKIFLILMAFVLVCSMAFLSACGPDEPTPCTEHTDSDGNLSCDICGATLEPSCTAHKDENGDKLCDLCGTEFFPRCSTHTDTNKNSLCDVCGADLPMSVEFFLKDQEGTVIAGVTVILTDEELNDYTFVTDDDGCGTLELYSGTYKVTYDTLSEGVYFPEGYLPIPSTVTVSTDNRTVDIEILKTVPNGEIDRPFPIDENTAEITLPASTLYYYIIYHSSGRNVIFEGSGFKVVYGDKEYLPNNEGKISFTLAEVEANENSHLTIENISDSEVNVKFSIYANPGSYGNPYEITTEGSSITANVTGSGVYYKYSVTADGTITVKTTQTLMFKLDTMADAKALVRVSGNSNTVDGVWELDFTTYKYIFTFADGTLVIEESGTVDESIAGTYTYTVSDDGVFLLENDANPITATLFMGGSTIVVTRSSDSKQTVISGMVDSETITVVAGEEINIFVNSEYSDEVVFEIDFERTVAE